MQMGIKCAQRESESDNKEAIVVTIFSKLARPVSR